MVTMKVKLSLDSYIAHPYWPEKNSIIEIEKKSGMNRCKSDKTRQQALDAQLKKVGMSLEEYERLKVLAARQWYVNESGLIYIPRHQMSASCVQLVASAPKALRGDFTKENLRAWMQISDFTTSKKQADGVFGRFVKLQDSNQRSWQENEYIGQYLDNGKPFTAVGTIGIRDERSRKTAQAIVEASVETVGVGAARKMGFGRGTVQFG